MFTIYTMKKILILGFCKHLDYYIKKFNEFEVHVFTNDLKNKYSIDISNENIEMSNVVIVFSEKIFNIVKDRIINSDIIKFIFFQNQSTNFLSHKNNIHVYKSISIQHITSVLIKNGLFKEQITTNRQLNNSQPSIAPNTAGLKPFSKMESIKQEYRTFCKNELQSICELELPIIQQNRLNEAVIVETRELEHFEIIVRNCIYKLGEEWSHTIICGKNNYNFISNMVSKINRDIKIIKLPKTTISQNDYNNMLLSIDFWNLCVGEKILIYQEDSFIFKHNIMDFINWDYIGAPFKFNCVDGINVGNGGLSLRSKSKMIQVLQNTLVDSFNVHELKPFVRDFMARQRLDRVPEDIYFSTCLQKMHIGIVADFETAKQFSSETVYFEDSFGMHCMWHGCRDWKKILLKQNIQNIKSNIYECTTNAEILFDNIQPFIYNCNTTIDVKHEQTKTYSIHNEQNKIYNLLSYNPQICVNSVSKNLRIPKIIYKIYVNGIQSEITNDIYTYAINKWKEMYEDYDIIIYDKPKIYEYLYRNYGELFVKLYDKLKPYAFKADFFRYCLLYLEGGVYSDLKQVPLKKINFDNKHFVACYEKHLCWKKIIGINFFPVQNCLIGCIKNHPYIKGAIDMCLQNIFYENYGLFCTDITGPVMFGRVIDNIRKNNEIYIDKTKETFMYFFEYNTSHGVEFFINENDNINSEHVIKHKYDNSKGGDWSHLSISNNYGRLWNLREVFNKQKNKQYNFFDSETFGLCMLNDKNILSYLENIDVIIIHDIIPDNMPKILKLILQMRMIQPIIFCLFEGEINIDNTFKIPGTIFDVIDVVGKNSIIITDRKISTCLKTFASIEYINNYNYNIFYKKLQIKNNRNFKYNIKPFFIYFPQFHTVPENDLNFYSGFDDYQNLLLLNSSEPDKYMETPDLNELGITTYNLTNSKILQSQIDILYKNNLPGFAMYYYWFSNNTITHKNTIFESVFDLFFNNIDMKGRKIFFIWANENWTDSIALSGENSHKIVNVYNEENIIANVTNLLKYFKSDIYQKFDNKPVLFLYHSFKMTSQELKLFYNILNRECINNSFDGVHLIVNTMFDDKSYDEYKQFYINLNYKNDTISKKYYSHNFKSNIVDYNSYISSGDHIKTNQINTIFYDFDNRARLFKPNKLKYSTYCINNTHFCKTLFTKKIIETYKDTNYEIDKILLINAWNEWGEKMTFEPSSEFGYNNLNLLLDCLNE